MSVEQRQPDRLVATGLTPGVNPGFASLFRMKLKAIKHHYYGLLKSAVRFPTYSAAVQNLINYSYDPVRYAALAHALARLDRENIPGAIAELGVWKGETSRLLQASAPERTIHLFDTFEGFDDGRFKDTSVQLVRQNIGNLNNVVFHVGLFPETTNTVIHERFAFVLLDADRFDSTLAGLEFFYPRTAAGGYIFLCDYNSPESQWGVSRAATEFLKDKPERLIDLPDPWGTAVFRKQ